MVNVFPLLSESFRTAEERFRFWQTAAVRALLAFTLLFAAWCMAGADDIVRTVYGEELADAASVLRILSINIAFFSLISVFWRSPWHAKDSERIWSCKRLRLLFESARRCADRALRGGRRRHREHTRARRCTSRSCSVRPPAAAPSRGC